MNGSTMSPASQRWNNNKSVIIKHYFSILFIALEGTQLYSATQEPMFSNLELGLIITVSIVGGLVVLGKISTCIHVICG